MLTCAKCNKSFSGHTIVDGKMRNLYKRKYCLDCSPFKGGNRRTLHKIHYTQQTKLCSRCNKWLDFKHFYAKGSDNLFSYCVDCERKRVTMRQQNFKQQCVAYKGGKCSVCGYSKCTQALDFHHKDPKEKDFNIGRKNHTIFNDDIKIELDKCILVCSNCHREIHYGFSAM